MLVALAQGALSLTLSSAWFAAGPVIVAPAPEATGTCPSGSDVEAALSARFPGSVRASTTETAPGQLRLETRLTPGQLRLEVRNERGDVLLRRQLPREGREGECRALAESVALIVDRYLRALLPEGATPPPERARPREPAPAPAPVPAPPPRPPASPATPPPAARATLEPTPSEPMTSASSEPAEPPERPPARSREPATEIAPPPETHAPVAAAVTKSAEAPAPIAGTGKRATVLSVHGGDRLADGSPGMSWEGRLGVQRMGALPGRGWIVEVQVGAGFAGSVTEAEGTVRLNRFPGRLGMGRSWPLGLGQLEASLGAGGDLLLRSFSPADGGSVTRDVKFVPVIDVHGGFRTLLSERLSLSLGVNVGWAAVRYDVGVAPRGNEPRGVLETPRFSVTPMLGLGLKIM